MKPEANPSSRGANLFRLADPLETHDPSAAAQAALALVAALLQALRDRGVLSVEELDDVMGEAGRRFGYRGGSRLIESLRGELARRADE